MGFLSSALGAVGTIAGTLLTNKSAKKEAEKNRDFQEEMSNTSISRRMQDLRNAGLNPLLAVDSASAGASTPSGGQANIQGFDSSFITAVANARLAKEQVKLEREKIETEKLNREAIKTNMREADSRIFMNSYTAEQMAVQTALNRKDLEFLNKNPNFMELQKYGNLYNGFGLLLSPLFRGYAQEGAKNMPSIIDTAKKMYNDHKAKVYEKRQKKAEEQNKKILDNYNPYLYQ